MPLLTPTDKPIYFSVAYGANTVASDVTSVGAATGTNNALVTKNADNPNDFLELVEGDAGNYNPLPSVGELVEAGIIYGYDGNLVICRQSHIRTNDNPATVPALFLTYQPGGGELQWIANEWIEFGDTRFYNDVEYRCIQPHQTVSGLTPDITPALWEVVATANEWTVGVAYNVDDVVSYQGVEYYCIQAHTSIVGWQPPNVPALWGIE